MHLTWSARRTMAIVALALAALVLERVR